VRAWIAGVVGLALGLAIAFGVAGRSGDKAALAQDAQRLAAEAAGPSAQPTRAPATATDLAASYAPVVRRAAPAVVNIYTARVTPARPTMMDYFRSFQGGAPMRPRVERSLGSGVIVAADGLVVTNFHVVAGAQEILVALADRREFPARLVFADEKTDLAALRIDPAGAGLPVARLGDSDRAEVGDVVLAIGNPFGVGQTVTQGIVSAIARNALGISDWQFFLQTDAAINPGNSGGALVSARGDVIGVNTAIFSRSGGSQGVGFAIPSNMVRQFIAAAGRGRLVRAWIGATGDPLTADAARAAGLDRPAGVIITQVTPGSPAARAGVRVGDVVYAIDGKDVADPASLAYRVGTQDVGAQVTLTLVRGGRAMNLPVRLEAPPETPPREETQLGDGSILAGVTIANLSPALAQELGQGLPDRGVVVLGLAAGAPLARLGALEPGDVIEALNGRPVASVGDVRTALAASGPGLLFRFNRQGRRGECAFAPPGQFGCRAAA
jgi:serine protease Do